jgi:tetratricopeptide (TPR) repeat protein
MRYCLLFILIIVLIVQYNAQNEDGDITAIKIDSKVQDSINTYFYVTHQKEFNSCEELLNKNLYDSAIVCYEYHLGSYPNNKYIYGQIRKSTPKYIYEDLIRKADGYFSQKKWKHALSFYYGAARFFPAERYPQDKISTLNKFIEEEEYTLVYATTREPTKEELVIAKVKQDSIAKHFRKEHQKEFKKLDKFQKQGKFNEARKECMNLMMTYKDVAFLGELHKELTQSQANKDNKNQIAKKNKEWIMKAYNYFKTKDYESAKKYYLQALQLLHNQENIIKRIKKIDAILRKQQNKENKKEAKKIKKHKKT